jgi:hypothetical protein
LLSEIKIGDAHGDIKKRLPGAGDLKKWVREGRRRRAEKKNSRVHMSRT